MKHSFVLLVLLLVLASCATPKYGGLTSPGSNPSSSTAKKVVVEVVDEAKSYLGTPYRYGGVDRNGLDCSGLMYLSFKRAGVVLPRISRDQAAKGVEVSKKNIQVGDLVFFATSGGSKITHVGLVTEVKAGEVFFIHSSSSKGVMISSMRNVYWAPRFVKAKRIL